MKRLTSLFAVALTVVAVVLHAETQTKPAPKPNFSGRWVQVTPADESQGGGDEEVVTQDATSLTTEHPSEGGSHKQTYKLDGESTTTMSGVTVVAKTAWDGQKLVISTAATYPTGVTRQSKQIWSLGADGLLTIDYTAGNPDGTSTQIKIVKKKRS